MTTGLSAIGQIGLSSTDLDRSIAFYRDQLGLPFLFRVPNLAFFDCGGIRLMLSVTETLGDRYGSILYFKTPDIHSAHNELRGRGVEFEREPHLIAKMPDHDLWMAFFRDPDRNLHALMSEVR